MASGKNCPEEICGEIKHVQHIMFEIGGYLATPSKEDGKETGGLDFLPEEITRLEGWIDSLDERVPKLRSFILPGGSDGSSRCHLARSICRRAERRIITLSGETYVDPNVISYVNRLSDYLFVAARYLNFLTGMDDIAWQPRKKDS